MPDRACGNAAAGRRKGRSASDQNDSGSADSIAPGAVALSAGVAGCGVSIPADPDSTLERVSGGTLRVGVTANGKWASVREGEEPGGIEPALVRSFASTISAVPEWVTGSEQELTKALNEGELDLVVGGLRHQVRKYGLAP